MAQALIEEILGKYDKIYPIRMEMPGSGLGGIMVVTMNILRYCERNNLYPVVSHDESCKTAFFDSEYGNELWEQYFEPVMALSYNDLQYALQEQDIQNRIFQLPSDEALTIAQEDPRNVYPFPFGKWRMEDIGDLDEWYTEHRRRGRETVSKYVRPKAHIMEKVQAFSDTYFQDKFVLGIHIRGTDMHYAPAVSPAEYFPHIDSFLEKEDDLKIFLATDQAQYIDVFKERYGDRLVYSDSFRSDNEVAPFARTEVPPYKKGEDVLLDMLLLSKANFLIKGSSNVGEMALYFNPALECTDLGYKKKKAFGQRYDEKWDNDSHPKAWTLISKRGLDQMAKDANSQNSVQAGKYEFRKFLKKVRVWLGALRRKTLN